MNEITLKTIEKFLLNYGWIKIPKKPIFQKNNYPSVMIKVAKINDEIIDILSFIAHCPRENVLDILKNV